MKIERQWIGQPGKGDDPWKEITEERAAMDLANKYGNDAIKELAAKKTLETRFGRYRVTE